MPRFKNSLVFAILLWSASAFAANPITGTVHNQTTGQPSAGDDVVLILLGQGMQEEARSKTDAQGAFSLDVRFPQDGHLIRVIHQGVNYDLTVTGTAPLEIPVYDVVPRIAGLAGNIGIAQVGSEGKTLEVTEMYAISNVSSPPVTQSASTGYEVSLPADAVFDSVEARTARGIWVKIAPAPQSGGKGRYRINFPMRPGDTLFKFSYHLPYSGTATIHLRLPYPIARFAVMHPPSMSFKALKPNAFKSPGMAGDFKAEQAVTTPLVGNVPAFEIAGAGVVVATAPPAQSAAPSASSTPPASAPTVVPAHPQPGAGAAPSAPDQSGRALLFVIPGSVVILALAGFVVWRVTRNRAPSTATGKPAGSKPVLEALKEELFQLESDRLHGSISQQEYTETREALNQSIQRILTREEAAPRKSTASS